MESIFDPLDSGGLPRQPTPLSGHRRLGTQWEEGFDGEPEFTMDRVLTQDDLESLARTLEDTDDTIECGLSMIGIDPDEMEGEIDNIALDLEEKLGFVFDEDLNSWVYE